MWIAIHTGAAGVVDVPRVCPSSDSDRMRWSEVVLMSEPRSFPPRCGKPICQVGGHRPRPSGLSTMLGHRPRARNPQNFFGCPLSLHRLRFLGSPLRRVGRPRSGRRECVVESTDGAKALMSERPGLASAAIASKSGRSWANTLSNGPRLARTAFSGSPWADRYLTHSGVPR